jgi:hypothetical protein
LLSKFDAVIELCRDRSIEPLCLTESWHDSDRAVLGRLGCAGFQVVDRPHPRIAGTDNSSVVIAAADVVLSPIAVADQPTIFELVCVRVVIGLFAAIVVVLYRPDWATVKQSFTTNWPPSWIALPLARNLSTLLVTSTFG